MKKQGLLYGLVLALTFSCVEPDSPKESSSSDPGVPSGPIVVSKSLEVTPIASKNYLQINNTYSKKTGISTSDSAVLDEFNAILMQLPTTSDPTSLNGFNQIAQARLAFAYCSKYVDQKYSSVYSSLSDENKVKKLLEEMVDVDVVNNEAHKALFNHLMAIMNDEDNLVDGAGGGTENEKLFKMTCAALLASSYVAML